MSKTFGLVLIATGGLLIWWSLRTPVDTGVGIGVIGAKVKP